MLPGVSSIVDSEKDKFDWEITGVAPEYEALVKKCLKVTS